MKYEKLTLGQVEAVVNKLGGMDGVKRFLSGELVIKEKECRFKIWKTIKLGTGLTVEHFRLFLNVGEFRLSSRALGIIESSVFTVATEESEVDIVKVTVAELGFKKGALTYEIYKRAKELGLELCPPELGPQLRWQYRDQGQSNDKYKWIFVAMKPIMTSHGDLSLFTIAYCGSELWLLASWGGRFVFWNADCQFVFCRPRK